MTNLELMRKRLEFQGGIKQEDRMIQDKYRTLLLSLRYSYQGCDVEMSQYHDYCLNQGEELHGQPQYRALINPDKLKQDYDDKIISIEYATGFGPGDIFRWVGTDTHWLIYLRAVTEDGYFRGEIRRCRYRIKFKNKDGDVKYTWAAIRGPVETQIDSIQKNQIRVDVPNLSLNILMPANPDTKPVFDRYFRFMFAGRAWKVSTANSISNENIIEVTAIEDYINEDADDQENELVDGLVIEKHDPNPPSKDSILGKTFIKPRLKEIYEVGLSGGCWRVKGDPPVQITPIDDDQGNKNRVQITWTQAVSGQFTLIWTNGKTTYEKIVVVESLF